MTSFQIEEFPFRQAEVDTRSALDSRYLNWPVVYTLNNSDEVYVGESLNVSGRFRQHSVTSKKTLTSARVILDETFPKSACLDLESYLIRLLAGDGRFQVLNRNDGITDAAYYERETYRRTFDEIFEELRARGLFTRTIREIVNTDLFKLSPFKALTPDQSIAVEDIVEGLFEDLERNNPSQVVIQGDPGTGKTIVGIYLMKLLSDIQSADPSIPVEGDSFFSDFFTEGHSELLTDFRIALVVPQQSLRRSIQKVFKQTPGLSERDVLTPFDVGKSTEQFDLLIVDEAHRLNQRASQSSGMKNTEFREINEALFGADDPGINQLDWLEMKSQHQIYLLDSAQAVRPADVPFEVIDELLQRAIARHRRYPLVSQMRVRAGDDYPGYIRAMLSDSPRPPSAFEGYDLRFYDSFGDMHAAIGRREQEHGLARLLAGYAWKWRSKGTNRHLFDITIEGHELRWNSTDVDWVNAVNSAKEVGSIHTIQGYDLNYAGVIIGRDLRYDADEGRVVFDRSHYFDAKGRENNRQLGITYSDDDILTFVRNIYAVLLTRGMLGTYIYVCDEALRDHLRPFLTTNTSSHKVDASHPMTGDVLAQP